MSGVCLCEDGRAIMCAVKLMAARKIFGWTLGILLPVLAVAAVVAWRASRPKMIAIVPETTAQEIWESEHAGATHAAQAFGWKVYWNGPSREDDFPRQVQIVRQAIARGAAGLVLSPDHDVVLISSVQAALNRKIPTVIVGSPLGISPSSKLVFVVNDDEATGRLAAERAAMFLKPGDSVAILGMNPNLLSSIERANAFEDAIEKRIPGIRIEERRSTSVSPAAAEEIAEDVIHVDPHLRVILALNVNQSRAVYGALLNTGSEGKISLIACDQDLDLLHHLRSGGIDSLIAQNTYAMGYDAIQEIHKQLTGEPTEQRIVIPPVMITRDNIDSEDVQKVLDMDWRVQE
jgi:ribose transport system substrate-binding protein